MRKPEVIKAGGRQIIYLDFSNLRSKEEILSQLDSFGLYLRKHLPNSVNTLTNLEGMYFNTEIYNAFVKYVNANNPYVKESAVIGLKGLMQIFYKGFVKITGRNVKVCNSKEEALNALAPSVQAAV